MRVLHTAAWHLGRLLEGRDRRAEQEAFVDEICRIADEQKADLVLIAGDVYDSVNPPAWAEELYYEALERLSAGGTRGVVVIAGNHDQPERVRAAAPLARRHGIVLLGLPNETPAAGGETAEPGRVRVVAAGPSWLEMAVPGAEHTAVIAALPYPSEARLRERVSESVEAKEMQAAFRGRIAAILRELSGRFRSDTVNLVTSHLFVAGGLESESERPIQLGGSHAIPLSAFPPNAHYVALGHLHRPQKLGDGPIVRYSGSPLAYSFSEAGQSKAVAIVDVTPQGEMAEELVYLTSGRPLVRWKATEGIPQVERWLAEGRDAGSWIELELHVTDAVDPAEFQRLRRLSDDFVTIQRVLIRTDGGEVDRPEGERRQDMNPEELFRRFYERKRGLPPDDRVVELFARLMAQPDGEEQGREAE